MDCQALGEGKGAIAGFWESQSDQSAFEGVFLTPLVMLNAV
jgi:hypothetical protein